MARYTTFGSMVAATALIALPALAQTNGGSTPDAEVAQDGDGAEPCGVRPEAVEPLERTASERRRRGGLALTGLGLFFTVVPATVVLPIFAEAVFAEVAAGVSLAVFANVGLPLLISGVVWLRRAQREGAVAAHMQISRLPGGGRR